MRSEKTQRLYIWFCSVSLLPRLCNPLTRSGDTKTLKGPHKRKENNNSWNVAASIVYSCLCGSLPRSALVSDFIFSFLVRG